MEKEVKKTGIIYARVSSWEQVSNTSLERQVRDCREYAERLGIEIVTEPFIEEGESAKSANRTEFQKAIKFCARKKPVVDFFIVHKIDRFARNQDDHIGTRAALKLVGTVLVSVTEPVDQTVMGRAMEGILSVFAELDNNIRAERSKSGMVEKVKKGFWVWSAPIGYKRIAKGGNLILNDEAAPFIRDIFREYATGTHSFLSLAEHMAKRGFRTRTGKKPGMQLIEKIVRNPVYCGIIRAFGGEYRAAFAPIVEEELFWKCQPGMRSKFGHGKRLRENKDFPLRRFVICTECGKSMTGSASTGRKGVKYPYYHHHKPECPLAKGYPKETFEQNFVEYLQSINPTKKYEKAFKAVVIDQWQSNYKRLDGENSRVRKEIEVLEAERQRVFDMHRAGKYSDDEFLEQKKLVLDKIREKKSVLNEKQVEEFNMEEALDCTFHFVRDSAKTWLELKDLPIQRARFQNRIFPEKVTFNGKKFGTKKISMIHKLNQEKSSEKNDLVTLQRIEL